MSNEELHKVILDQLQRFDANQVRLFEKLDEQGDTLARLTTTVEIHKNYSINLEKEQKTQRKDINKLKENVHVISHHVDKVDGWIQMIRPTKVKVAVILALLSTFGGPGLAKSDLVQNLLKALISPQSIQVAAPATSAHEPSAE